MPTSKFATIHVCIAVSTKKNPLQLEEENFFRLEGLVLSCFDCLAWIFRGLDQLVLVGFWIFILIVFIGCDGVPKVKAMINMTIIFALIFEPVVA